MKISELDKLKTALTNVPKESPMLFQYKIGLIKKKISDALEVVEEIKKSLITEGVSSFEQKRQDLISKNASPKEIEKMIEDNYQEYLEYSEVVEKINTLYTNESGIEIKKFKIEEVPDTIESMSMEDVEALFLIVE